MSILRKELSLNDIFLNHENLKDFACFETKRIRHYRIWRALWALYHVIWIVLTGLISHYTEGENSAQQIKWFIYLTNWSYLTLTLTTIFDLISVCRIQGLLQAHQHQTSSSVKDDNSQGHSLPLVTKLTWVFFNMSNATAIAVTALYWSFDYDGNQSLTVVNIATHVLNSVYVIINVIFSSMPVKILHVTYPILFSITYVLFTYIYQIYGGKNNRNEPYVYEILNWADPQHSMFLASLVTFVGVPICHLVIFGIFVSKRFISEYCCSEQCKETIECQIEGLLQVTHKEGCAEMEL